MRYSKCTCVNVEICSYDNQVTVRIPPHMNEYKNNRVAAGLSPYISIDKCILEEIECLWALGVKTSGSCCGHGKAHAYIGVLDSSDISIMNMIGYTINDEASCNPANHFIM